jgi:uncharacterized membrane protein YbaN (DUF454 family)
MAKNTKQKDTELNPLIRNLLIIAGFICVGLGIIGIVLPVLPTTPFLLLAAACFSRSSKRFHNWLITNRWFGKYIKNYQEGNGISIKAKICAISFMWIALAFSIVFVIHEFLWQLILIIIGIIVAVHIIRIKTFKQ